MEQFPDRTADEYVVHVNARPAKEVTLPSEAKVWVQTLNSIHREEADREAGFHAAVYNRRFVKGGDLYDVYMSDFTGMETNDQVSFLVNHEILRGGITLQATTKYEYPIEPVREMGDGVGLTGESDAAWIQRVEEFEREKDKVTKQRNKFVEKWTVDKRKELEAVTAKTRIKKCMDAFLEAQYSSQYAKRLTDEMLYRAIRRSDIHAQKYYATPDEVRDLDDEVRQVLVDAYRELDRVRPEEVPT